jgi:hypothetical protein
MADTQPFEGINARCYPGSTYSFTLNTTKTVAHLLSLSFTNAGIDLVADTSVLNPESPEEDVSVIGVFDHISWKGATDNPVEMQFRLSPANGAIMNEAIASPTGGSEIKAKWVLYKYDEVKKVYFKAFDSDEQDILFKLTEGTTARVEDEANLDIKSPKNFSAILSLTGNSEGAKQKLNVAFSATAKSQRPFGTHKTA